MAYKASFGPLNPHRKGKCGNPSCKNQATMEAAYRGFVMLCCDEEKCRMYAAKEAVDQEETLAEIFADLGMPLVNFNY